MSSVRPWFLTFSGQQFFYDAPEEYDYTIQEIGHVLARVCRFAGHLEEHYSVAQHSALVAEEVSLVYPDSSRALLRAALLHDASEAFLLDIPRPMKRLPGFEAYRELEDRTQRAILRRFGLEDWHEHAAIKGADMRLLRAEKAAIRPQHPFFDVDDRVGAARVDVVKGLPVHTQRAMFLTAWRCFGGPP